MTFDEIEHGKIYECQMTGKIAPLVVQDKLPTGILAKNLDSGREVFINKVDVPRRFKTRIANMSEWRLHNGD